MARNGEGDRAGLLAVSGWVVGLMGISFVAGIGGFLADSMVNGGASPTVLSGIVGRGATTLAGLLMVWWLATKHAVSRAQIVGRVPSVEGLLCCMFGAAVLYLCQETTVLYLRQQLPLTLALERLSWPLLSAEVATGAVFAGGFEEVFFRGLLYSVLCRRGHGSLRVVIMTSVLFSAYHVELYWAPIQLAFVSLLGVVAGVVRWKSDSLALSVVLHVVHNIWVITVSGMSGGG